MGSTGKKNTGLEIYNNRYMPISNEYLTARTMQSSLMESKAEMLAIVKLGTEGKYKEKKDALGNKYTIKYVEITTGEMRKINDTTRGDLYDVLYKISVSLKQKVYVTRDFTEKTFNVKSFYKEVTYDKGVMQVEFDPDSSFLVDGLTKSYTKIPLDVVFSLNTYGGFNMYKIFEKEMFRLPKIDLSVEQENQPSICLQYNINDFRYMLGFLDITQDTVMAQVSAEVAHDGNADFDSINSADKSPKYSRFTDLKRRIIDPGVEELNKKTDMYVASVEKITQGSGGRIVGIEIVLQRNVEFIRKKEGYKKKETHQLVEKLLHDLTDEQEKLLAIIKSLIPAKLVESEYLSIAKAADFNLGKVQKAVEILNCNTGTIYNVAGFLLAAINNEYDYPTEARTRQDNYGSYKQFSKIDSDLMQNDEALEFQEYMERMREDYIRHKADANNR